MKKIFVLLFMVVAIAATFFMVGDASSTVSVYSLPQVIQSVHATGTGTSLSVTFPLAPPVGDTIVCTESDAYPGNVSAPSGYVQFGTTATSTNSVSEALYYHIVASGEGNPSHTFTITTSATWLINCDDWHGTNATVPIEASVATAQATSVSSLSLPSLLPNEPGTVGVEVSAQNIANTNATDGLFPNSVWTVSETGLSVEEDDMTQAWTPFTNTLAGNPSFVSKADSVSIVYVMRPLVGNYTLGGRVVAVATATPQAGGGGTNTIPPLGPWENYFGTNITSDAMAHISPANLAKWGYYCQGGGATTAQTGGDSGGANILECAHPYTYTALNMFQPNPNGNVSTVPWLALTGSNCPSDFKVSAFATQHFTSTTPDAPDWTSTDATKNWFVYEGTIGSDASRVQGYYGSTHYTFFINLNSTELVASTNNATQKCSYDGYPLDGYEGDWNDNGFFGLTQYGLLLWNGNDGGYSSHVNWGTVNGTPYSSSSCNGGPNAGTAYFNGTVCTTGTQINSTANTAGNTTYGPDTGTGTSKTSTTIKGWQYFTQQIKHANGSLIKWQFNYLINGYAACQINNLGNVTGGIHESATSRGWGDGRLQATVTIEGIIDTASDVYACQPGGTFMIHDYMDNTDAKWNNGGTLTTVTGAGAIGTAVQQMDTRAHIFLEWLLWNDKYPTMMGSMVHQCDASGSCGSTYKSWTDVYSYYFASPANRTTAYPTEALSASNTYCSTQPDYNYLGTGIVCATGGSHDTHICATGTAPNCLFIANFSDFDVWNYTVCGAPDLTKWNSSSGCVKDIGPFTVLYNLTGGAVTLSAANLSSWIGSTQYNNLNYVLWPGCVPNSSAYTTTSGQPLYQGTSNGAAGNTAPSTTNMCASGAGDVYNSGRMGFISLPTILGTTLVNGESIGFTAAQQ